MTNFYQSLFEFWDFFVLIQYLIAQIIDFFKVSRVDLFESFLYNR
jgi:hypothetical protein